MKVIVVKNASELGKQAFDLLAKAVDEGAKTLGLATGSSPVELYQEMVASQLDFSQMTSVNLDEYVGLSPENPQSYHYFMKQHLFQYKPFKRSYLPDGEAEDIQKECDRYNQILADNPVDLQILGIGQNGHIAFNEPGSSLNSLTRVKTLTTDTRIANSRFFGGNAENVPAYALTVGVGTVMAAKEVLILCNGHNKAKAMQAAVEGPVTQMWTISALQLHRHGIIVCDDAATDELKVGTYRYFKDIEKDQL